MVLFGPVFPFLGHLSDPEGDLLDLPELLLDRFEPLGFHDIVLVRRNPTDVLLEQVQMVHEDLKGIVDFVG